MRFLQFIDIYNDDLKLKSYVVVVVDFLYCLYAQSLAYITVESKVKTKVDTSVKSLEYNHRRCSVYWMLIWNRRWLFISTGDRTDRRPVTAPVSGRTGCRHDTPPAERSAAAVTGSRHAEPVVMRRCVNPVIRSISSTEAMHMHMQPTRTCVSSVKCGLS